MIYNHTDIPCLVGEDVVLMAAEVNEPTSSGWMLLQQCHGQFFLTVLRKQVSEGRTKLIGRVHVLNTQASAAGFIYTLELCHTGVRSYSFTSFPSSVLDPIDPTVVNCDCLELDWQKIKLFVHEEALRVVISVKRR